METECPNCGYLIPVHYKDWPMKTWKSEPLRAYLFVCPKCGKKTRKVIRVNEDELEA